jgi:hypothetical protein
LQSIQPGKDRISKKIIAFLGLQNAINGYLSQLAKNPVFQQSISILRRDVIIFGAKLKRPLDIYMM